MDTFLTVLKTGGRYRSGHVARLQAQIDDYYPNARHICLTDDPDVKGDVITLAHAWPGWWSKLELFRHELGRCCYLDLDVTVRGSLEWVDRQPLDSQTRMWAMKDAFCDGMNSSVMIWDGSKSLIHQRFDPSLPEQLKRGGDQRWIWRALGADQVAFLLPPEVCSFKKHGAAGGSVVVYHGEPKPWDEAGVAKWLARLQ